MRSSLRLLLAVFIVAAGAYGVSACEPTCHPGNCETCCDPKGYCVLKTSDLACGASGSACVDCSIGSSCLFGRCTPRNGQTGGFGAGSGNSGGGSGGGAPGGGQGGGGHGGGTLGGGGFGAGSGSSGGGNGGGMVERCTPSNCEGCCDVNNFCHPGTTTGRCGKQGAVCEICTATEVCTAGACAPSDAAMDCAARMRCARPDGLFCGEPCSFGCCLPNDPRGQCITFPDDEACGKNGSSCAACGPGLTCKLTTGGSKCE